MKRVILLMIISVIFAGQLFAADGIFIKFKKRPFKSAHLIYTPKLIIYLPKGYSNSTKHYPVLYAHDGQNLFDVKTSFAGEWKMDENIDELVRKGLMDDIIVVGMYNTARRMYDYTPTKVSNKYVNNEGGDLDKHAKYIVEELKPYIDKNYRTLPDKANTGIIGSSLGGLSSFYIIGKYPAVFSKAGVISASFWWDDNRVIKDMDTMKFDKNACIYIDGGHREGSDESSMITYMRNVNLKLKKLGLKDFKNIFYYEDPVGTHSESAWAKRGKMPLFYMFGKFKPVPKKLTLLLKPEIVEAGDTADIQTEVDFGNGMKSTIIGGNLKSTSSAATVSDGKLVAKKAGDAKLSITVGGKTLTETIAILPKVEGSVHSIIYVKSKTPVESMSLIVIKENDNPVNREIVLKMIDDNTGSAVLTMPKGTKIVYNIKNGKGELSRRSKGKPTIKTAKFTKNKVRRVKVKEWK